MKLALFIIMLPHILFASTDVSVCGEYTIKGIIRAKDSTMALVVNEKTFSEHNVKFPVKELIKVAAFLDQPVLVKLQLLRKFNGQEGISDKVITIDMHYLDSLNQDTKRILLNKKMDCLK